METSKLSFSKSHEWIEFLNENAVRVGITDFAQNALGDLVFVNLPENGTNVVKGEAFAEIESVKSASEIFSPVTGEVSAVNEELLDSPEKINQEPYESWLVEIKNISDKELLLNAEEYEKYCAEEA